MDSKYVATVDFTSLNALKSFIKVINEAGGSAIIDQLRPDLSSMLDHPILIPGLKAESIFIPEIKIYASTPIDLERAKEVLGCQLGEKVEKSASSTLLESISNFRGFPSHAR